VTIVQGGTFVRITDSFITFVSYEVFRNTTASSRTAQIRLTNAFNAGDFATFTITQAAE
jgi:hypothetical protein